MDSSATQTIVTIQTPVIDVSAMSPAFSASCKEVVWHKNLGYQGTPKHIPCINLSSFLFIKEHCAFRLINGLVIKGTRIIRPTYCADHWNLTA